MAEPASISHDGVLAYHGLWDTTAQAKRESKPVMLDFSAAPM